MEPVWVSRGECVQEATSENSVAVSHVYLVVATLADLVEVTGVRSICF